MSKALIILDGYLSDDATTFSFKRNGEASEATKFRLGLKDGFGDSSKWINFDVTVFNNSAKFAATLVKGDRVLIQGDIKNGDYEKDGVKVYKMTVSAQTVDKIGAAGENKGENRSAGASQAKPAAASTKSSAGNSRPAPAAVADDDDCPF